MIAPIGVALVAIAALVLITFAIVRSIPRTLWRTLVALGMAVIISIPLSFHARAKAIRLGEALMEPSRAPQYHRWLRFELFTLSWNVHYTSGDVHAEDQSVSVGLLGGVSYGSKYFLDRAQEISLR